ncbi:MAG: type II toxin-antitoxin system MqsR family toxin [Ignavibacteriales bacterium]|nr:type II toxin-antitoxin system MqsR family toxin [Ignavibacteriales bacterium]
MQISKIDKIERFLTDFKQKLKVFDIAYHRSDDNTEAVSMLDINPKDRKDFLLKLTVKDYYKGPNPDLYDPYGSPVWEFGKVINNKEVYIKISLGTSGKPVICKSFHLPKRKIKYPYKKENS